MNPTLRITHIATGAEAVTVQTWQADVHPPEPVSLVAEHRLAPGDTTHVCVREQQHIVIVPAEPGFVQRTLTRPTSHGRQQDHAAQRPVKPQSGRQW